jgi:hypothetical protein
MSVSGVSNGPVAVAPTLFSISVFLVFGLLLFFIIFVVKGGIIINLRIFVPGDGPISLGPRWQEEARKVVIAFRIRVYALGQIIATVIDDAEWM